MNEYFKVCEKDGVNIYSIGLTVLKMDLGITVA